ncbi:hypothetical protein D9M70_604060 [compost metagenome]
MAVPSASALNGTRLNWMRAQTKMKTTSRKATMPTMMPISVTLPPISSVMISGSTAALTCRLDVIVATAITRRKMRGVRISRNDVQ